MLSEVQLTILKPWWHTMWSNADLVTKLILLLLLISSVVSIAIIISKYLELASIRRKIKYFKINCWASASLEQNLLKIRKTPNNPLCSIFLAGVKEVQHSSFKHLGSYAASNILVQAMNAARNREIEKIGGGLTLLATIGSYVPFVGLFGMLWGVIQSFNAIGAAQNVSLNVIAPGMAEALTLTAIGIAVALPASVFYNLLADKFDAMAEKIDDMTQSFFSALMYEISNKGSTNS